MGNRRRFFRKGSFTLMDGTVIDANQRNARLPWMYIISFPINAPNARAFMKSHSVLRFVPWTFAFPMRCTGKP